MQNQQEQKEEKKKRKKNVLQLQANAIFGGSKTAVHHQIVAANIP